MPEAPDGYFHEQLLRVQLQNLYQKYTSRKRKFYERTIIIAAYCLVIAVRSLLLKVEN
jgi:hypothetical protein